MATILRTLDRVASNPVPVAGAVLLGAPLASLGLTRPFADPLALASHALLVVAASLATAVDDSATPLENGRVASLFEPVELHD